MRWLLLPIAGIWLHAATMTQLFDALAKQPQTRLNETRSQLAELGVKRAKDRFWPSLSLFASFEHYNSPTNLRPMSPTESAKMSAEGNPLPFATTIERLGARVSLPLFAKELFSLSRQAEAMAESAKAKERLDFLQNEALLVGADASWRHLRRLEAALKARMRSIEKTRRDTEIKVQSGRAPGIALDKLDEGLNRLRITLNDLHAQESLLKSRIEALTGMRLENPAPLTAVQEAIEEGELFAITPLRHLLKAQSHAAEAAKDRLYPKVVADAYWSENYGQNAVAPLGRSDTADDVHRGYGRYMVGLTMPLFEKGLHTDIERAEVRLREAQLKLAQTRQELEAKAGALRESLALARRSRELAQKSVQNEKNLLAYAKVAYETGRLSEEEYLRYEEGMFAAQSKQAEAEAAWWQTLAQLAVIYGSDLREIVK
ncbi:TolC family protein [Hydrogenimonas sp.]|uniref:TolC family protein n=1 Tax=Hydrogenimonas sp. TaxID=2231112 RepID=UPI0026233573|nr:TolC family protein [Hydrogenimonas sp.]